MPFCKRTIVPKDVCKSGGKSRGAMFTDLVDVCGLTLCAVLRQLSDLSRQSVSILEELEGELASICYRSGALENKLISLQKHISALATKPPVKTRHVWQSFFSSVLIILQWQTTVETKYGDYPPSSGGDHCGFFGWELFSTAVWGLRSGPSGDCLMGTGGEGAD
ncbi:hypothetical protein DPX16_13569 [Anabarilius grahami]|uniref:Uncharacterized protein n=1 Tax=Anabarilius grahami TaxID=495550 RepID=A0A3N0YCY9_ANAGA|nr:hypothetical protein DPX16_13569 [Anabarilius grahami]